MVYLFIIVGLFFGSFYYVVGDRLSKDESLISPGSHCESCNKSLVWYELIPVISFIILRGKCSKCGTKLGISYLLVEILTGLLFGLSYMMSNNIYDLIVLITISSLLVITYISDFKYLYILDIPLILSYIIILSSNFIINGYKEFLLALWSALILFIIMYLIKFVGDKVFKRESLGFGDVKLACLFGMTLGFQLSFVALIIASLLTLPFAIYFVKKSNDVEVPYGPFLITGVYVVYMFNDVIWSFLNNLFI